MDITDCKEIYDVAKRKDTNEFLSSEMSMLVRPSETQRSTKEAELWDDFHSSTSQMDG